MPHNPETKMCNSTFGIVERHQWEILIHILEKDPSAALRKNQTGCSLLHILIDSISDDLEQDGAITCVINILKSVEGIHATSTKNRDGYTALHHCCSKFVSEEILMLIARKNPFALGTKDNYGDTPLHKALENGMTDEPLQSLMRLAYDNMNSNEQCCFSTPNKEGNLPLHFAISHEGSSKVVATLLDIYPEGILSLNSEHMSPLFLASICERYDLIHVFLTSHATLGVDCIDTLLRIEGNTCETPLYTLWKNHTKESQGRGEDHLQYRSKALDCIMSLLSAYFSNERSILVSSTITELTAREILLVAISLGNNIVPPAFVLLLVTAHPSILEMVDSLSF